MPRGWRGGRHAHVALADVSDFAALEAAAVAIEAALGPIDVWVNNAGIGFYGEFAEVPEDAFRRVIDVNLSAPSTGPASRWPGCAARPRHHRPGAVRDLLSRRAAADGLFGDEIRVARLHRGGAGRVGERAVAGARHDGPSASGQHAFLQPCRVSDGQGAASATADLPAGDARRGDLPGRHANGANGGSRARRSGSASPTRSRPACWTGCPGSPVWPCSTPSERKWPIGGTRIPSPRPPSPPAPTVHSTASLSPPVPNGG